MRKARLKCFVHLDEGTGKTQLDSISLSGNAAAIDMNGDIETALILIDCNKGAEDRFNIAVAGEVFGNLFVIHSENTGTVGNTDAGDTVLTTTNTFKILSGHYLLLNSHASGSELHADVRFQNRSSNGSSGHDHACCEAAYPKQRCE